MKRSFKTTVAAFVLALMLAPVLAASVAYAKAGYVPLPVKVTSSDLIAKVEILSVTQVVPYFEKPETGPPRFRHLEPGEYRSQAEVKVIQSIKGLQTGETYILEFDNGLLCPNVWYKKGEECLVFHTKRKNGHYETFNTYYGKYTVKEDRVIGWKPGSDQGTPLSDVLSEITGAMQSSKMEKESLSPSSTIHHDAQPLIRIRSPLASSKHSIADWPYV